MPQLISGQQWKCNRCQTAVDEDKVGAVIGCLDVSVESRMCRTYASAAMQNPASLFMGRLELLLWQSLAALLCHLCCYHHIAAAAFGGCLLQGVFCANCMTAEYCSEDCLFKHSNVHALMCKHLARGRQVRRCLPYLIAFLSHRGRVNSIL
jgi:hypothetical protein